MATFLATISHYYLFQRIDSWTATQAQNLVNDGPVLRANIWPPGSNPAELVTRGKTGCVEWPDNTDTLPTSIFEMPQNNGLVGKMRRREVQQMQRLFTWLDQARQILNLNNPNKNVWSKA